MEKELLKNYAELKAQIKELEANAKAIQPLILKSMQDNDLDEVTTAEGKFSLSSRRKYTYPAELADRELALKEDKKTAEQVGEAKYEETFFVTYKA